MAERGMFARISAKILMVVAAAALVFFGVGLLGLALAAALTKMLGTAGADAVTGAILIVPVAIWILVIHNSKPPKPQPVPASGFVTALMSAVARETPWAAVLGAGLAGATDLFLRRYRVRPKK